MSTIPIYGLVHLVDVKSLVEADDGAGGITVTEKNKLSSVVCRVTTLTAKDAQEVFGLASGEYWKIICDGTPNIERSDIVKLSAKSATASIDANIPYRVLKTKKQIDHIGSLHHLSLIVEREDQDS